MSTAYSGYDGVVMSGGTDLEVKEYTLSAKTSSIDITTTSDAGYTNSLPGPVQVTGKCTFFYDEAKRPTGALVGLMPGATTDPVLKFFVGGGDFITGTARITGLNWKSGVKDAIEVEAEFENKGPWTFPS